MADAGRYYDESDPEWAVSRLAVPGVAAHRAAPRRRRRVTQVAAGLVGLLLVGTCAFALTDSREPEASSRAPVVPPSASPTPVPRAAHPPVAPRVTLKPVPVPVPERQPAAPASPRPASVVSATAAPTSAPRRKPTRPDNQVGPNKTLTKPVAP